MAIFAVTYHYIDDPAALDAQRPTHRAYLNDLADAGSLRVSGPYVGGDAAGALLIFAGETEAQVRALVAADPFVRLDLVETWTVREWNPVLGPAAAAVI